jgi:transcriptional regulator with XRE-family HTH domain
MEGRKVHGRQLKLLREQAGLHRRELATAIDCSVGHLKNVELEVGRDAKKPESIGHQLSAPKVYRARRVLSEHLGRDVSIDEFTTLISDQAAA